MSEPRTCMPGRICGGADLFDEIERLTAIKTALQAYVAKRYVGGEAWNEWTDVLEALKATDTEDKT